MAQNTTVVQWWLKRQDPNPDQKKKNEVAFRYIQSYRKVSLYILVRMKYTQEIVIREITENKEALIKLLLIADPSVKMIKKYLGKGHLFSMQTENEIVCAAVVVSDKSTAEIKNLVTHPDHLRKGYASRMISFIVNYFKDIPEIIVGTGSTGIPEREFYQLTFYRKCGFVDSHIIKNFFIHNYPEPIFEDNGEQCIDMLYLKYLPEKNS